jgi:hypothetical protein
MSNDKRDQPTAGYKADREYERDQEDQTPEKGRLFVKRGDGSVLLGQTDKTFGKGHGHRDTRH